MRRRGRQLRHVGIIVSQQATVFMAVEIWLTLAAYDGNGRWRMVDLPFRSLCLIIFPLATHYLYCNYK